MAIEITRKDLENALNGVEYTTCIKDGIRMYTLSQPMREKSPAHIQYAEDIATEKCYMKFVYPFDESTHIHNDRAIERARIQQEREFDRAMGF